MSEVTLEVKNIIAQICASTRIFLTDEQKEAVYRFKDNLLIDASPGVGKTTTAIVGLIAAPLLFGIKSKNINAMSYTRAATAEIAGRYLKACKKAGINPNVQFNTFHSICRQIMVKVNPKFEVRGDKSLEDELRYLSMFMKDEGVAAYDDMYLVKGVFRAITALNAELMFSKSSVENHSKFMAIEDKIDIRTFQLVRKRWIYSSCTGNSCTESELPIAMFFTLLFNPELSDWCKNKYKLMLVDEFQDVSVLYLEVLSKICDKLIVIGDLKQQIYGFNGASLLIVDAYKELYPDAEICEVTQSFRCHDEIVVEANRVIAPNEILGFDNFKGIGKGGSYSVLENKKDAFNLIIDDLKANQDRREYNDVMFLARNNSSVIPIMELLYRRDIVFHTTKFMRVDNLPVFKDLFLMAGVAMNSTDPDYLKKIGWFMPEFRRVQPENNPIVQINAMATDVRSRSLLTMEYKFKEKSSYDIINRLKRFIELDSKGEPFSVSCLPLLQIYEDYIIKGFEWRLDNPVDYYFRLADSIIRDKNYSSIIYDENEKARLNELRLASGEGVRCYTFHSSKGLEAEKVYMLDVDDGIIPKASSMNKLIERGCLIEAARELRNERNLLYVAMTRCKKDLTIFYNNKLSSLIDNPSSNQYTMLDKVWREKAVLTNETKAFKSLMGIK